MQTTCKPYQPVLRPLWVAVVFCLLLVVQAKAEWLYETNFNSALALAKKEHRMVILYIGRAQFCTNDNPRLHFFDGILKKFPKLAARSSQLIVCEQFIHAPPHDPDGKISMASLREANRLDWLYEKYRLHLYNPTLIFLDADGTKLNGPFIQQQRDFASARWDCYEQLEDYLDANPPLRASQAMSNLVSVALNTNHPRTFAMFHTAYHREGGQKELLLEDGVTSKRYELGKPFHFSPREAGVLTVFDAVNKFWISELTVAGTFERETPFTGPVRFQLNGAYFPAEITETDSWTGHNDVSFRTNEYFFSISTWEKPVADALLEEFHGLGASITNRTLKQQ